MMDYRTIVTFTCLLCISCGIRTTSKVIEGRYTIVNESSIETISTDSIRLNGLVKSLVDQNVKIVATITVGDSGAGIVTDAEGLFNFAIPKEESVFTFRATGHDDMLIDLGDINGGNQVKVIVWMGTTIVH